MFSIKIQIKKKESAPIKIQAKKQQPQKEYASNPEQSVFSEPLTLKFIGFSTIWPNIIQKLAGKPWFHEQMRNLTLESNRDNYSQKKIRSKTLIWDLRGGLPAFLETNKERGRFLVKAVKFHRVTRERGLLYL